MPIPRLHKETPLYSKVKSVGAYLKLLADSIMSLVQMDETYTDPSGNTVANHAASLIKQNADNILLRVEKNGVISSINQSPEQVTINASKVNIEGAALFTTGRLSKVVRTTNTQWYSSTSRTSLVGGSWSTTQPTITAGHYLWQREYVTYSNGDTEYKPSEGGVCVTPDTDAVTDVVVEYAQNQSQTSAPTGASDWSTTPPAYRENWYIWQRTKKVTSSGTTYSTPTCISGRDGHDAVSPYAYALTANPASLVRGEDGTVSPSSITFSAMRAQGTGNPSAYAGRFVIAEYDGSSWSNKYTSAANESSKAYSPSATARLVRCNLYLAGGTSTLADTQTVPVASDGGTGKDAYTVLLTNESHTFAASTGAAVASSATTQVIAYKGRTRVAATIGSVTGKVTGMTTAISNNGKTNATLTVSVTTSLTTRQGTLSVPVTVDDQEFTLTFSWSLALTGATGAKGRGISSIVPQYYLSTSSTTQTGGSWVTTQPAWVDGCYYWTRSMVTWDDNTTTYTTPVLANGLNGSLALAHGAYNSGAGRTQYIWIAKPSGTNSVLANTTWVTETGDVQNQWTAVRPTFNTSYPVVFMAKQTQTVAQLSGTACSCTTPIKDTTTTHIDGAQIVTGTIDATKVTVTGLDAGNITTGYLSAARIKNNTLSVDKFNNYVQESIANGVTAYMRENALRGTCSDSPTSGTKRIVCNGMRSSDLVAGLVIKVYNSTASTYTGGISLCVSCDDGDSMYTNAVRVGGEAVGASNQLLWAAGSSITYVYDGTYWNVADATAEMFTSCTTAAATAAKVANMGQCVIFRGTQLTLSMTYRNTAASPTLNVSSLGAKEIYYGAGTSVRPTVDNGKSWLNGTMAPFTFDGRYWRFGTRTYVDGGDIVANSITANQIAAHTITADEISTGYVYAGTIKASQITAGTMKGDRIYGGTIKGTTFESESSSGNKMTINDSLISFINKDDPNHRTAYIDCQYENTNMHIRLRHSNGPYVEVGSNGVVIGSREYLHGYIIRVLQNNGVDILDTNANGMFNLFTDHNWKLGRDDQGYACIFSSGGHVYAKSSSGATTRLT